MLAASSAALAACGGSAPARPEPHLRHADAARLITVARRIASEASSDRCAAGRDAAALSTRANSLVAAGRVPVRLRAPLLAGVAAVAADVPRCPPPAAPAPAAPAAPTAPPKHGHGHAHGHGHGQGKGHGHGNGDDRGD